MIVEDQMMVRQFLEGIVDSSERYKLVFSIRNADLADVYCEREKPDLILMDVYTDMGASGLEAAARIHGRFPDIKIIIMTSMPEFSYIRRARECGVSSFMYKEISKEPVLEIMDRTMEGEQIWPDRTPEVKLGSASSYDFSYRELEVLRELTSGDTNEQIADRLSISVATVKTHINNLMSKTGFKSRTELAIKAREQGLVIRDN